MGPLSYEGLEKYIFISYAHKDSPQVLRVLEQLVERGYRIWYDDGLAPGSEWPEEIAEHLDNCAVFMTFISNNAMESANCRREINFALSRQKPFLGIILEPTKMTLGMEMQLSSQHCLVMDNYRNEKDFLHKLFLNEDIKCCKAPQPEVQVVPEQTVQAETKPVVQAKKATKPATRSKTIPVVTPEPPKSKPVLSFFKKLLLGIFALILLVGAVGAGLLLGSYVTILPDVRASRYTASLTLREQQITADAVKKINTLEELNTLYFYDCTIDEGALDALSSATLRLLHVENSPITNLSFLINCPEVNNLTLDNCGITNASFKDVDTGRMDYVTLSRNPKFSDLTLFTSENLRRIEVEETAVSDVSHLKNFPKLSEVNCSNTKVSSIDALAELEHLTVLECSQCPISKVTTPFMSLSMHVIDMNGCGLKSLTGFENFTVLQRVYLSGNQLKDVSWLAKSVNTLTDVGLHSNPLTKEGIGFIKDAVHLTYLGVSGITLGDTALFERLTKLEVLDAAHCGISDLTQMAGLTELSEVYLSNNKISDLTGLPPFVYTGYSKLDLAYNKITDITPIVGERFGVLALQGNPVQVESEDLARLGGSLLAIDYHESMLESQKLKFSRVYVKGCPADKQLALEKAVGYGFSSVTEAVMLDALEQKGFYYE